MPAVSMLDKSGFYWLEARFVFYKIATVWRNLELILHSSSLQRSLHPQKLTSPLKKRGHLENRKRIILKNHNIFQGAVTFWFCSWGDVNLHFFGAAPTVSPKFRCPFLGPWAGFSAGQLSTCLRFNMGLTTPCANCFSIHGQFLDLTWIYIFFGGRGRGEGECRVGKKITTHP